VPSAFKINVSCRFLTPTIFDCTRCLSARAIVMLTILDAPMRRPLISSRKMQKNTDTVLAFRSWGRSAMFMLSTHLILYSEHSYARLYCGRRALMAKALGTTPEGEHWPALVPLARVSINFIIDHTVEGQYLCCSANKRARWTVFHRYGTSRPQEVIEWFKGFHKPDILHGLANAHPAP
jgi:hypothetical protein